MDNVKNRSIGSESDQRSNVEGEFLYSGTRSRNLQGKTSLRSRLVEKAMAFSKSSSYLKYVFSKDDSNIIYRNAERDAIQGEANRSLMRKDCFQANYNDYIPSSFDKEMYERDRLINIPLDELDEVYRLSPNQEKMFSIGNMKTPFEFLNSNMSFNTISLNKSFIKSNFTFNTTNQFSIGTSNQSVLGSNAVGHSSIGSGSVNRSNMSIVGMNQSSIGSGPSSLPTNQSSIGSGVSNQIPINHPVLGNINQSSIGSRNENVIVELIKSGMSPGEVAKLSDVFQYPSCFRKVTSSIIPWLQKQRKLGYWNNNSSLFILCLTMALSVGSVETIFKLNSTWGGLIFLVTYLVAFLFIVQPMFCFELGLGQLFRCSPFEIFDKLVPGMGGVGMAMVILCLLSACIACSRTCSEFLIYFVNVFRKSMLWDLSVGDVDRCASIGQNVVECTKLNPLCYIVNGTCKANRLGKAYLAYQDLFDNPDVDLNKLDYRLILGIFVTYVLVFILQMIGMTNFTFFAFILVVVIFFLAHAQVYFSMLLEGSATYVLDSVTKIDYKLLYTNSRLWSHSVRCCIYEYVIGNGIYSTLASKSRIGYDLSYEALGVGLISGYITSLQFFSALALVGYFCVYLSKMPSDILWMLEQDSSFVLLPMGFVATHNMERTLLVLQFCSCFILITFTLSLQIEVILTTLARFIRIKRVYVSGIICTILFLGCIPLCNRGGKRVIWFLEIAVGDLGRVFMVLMTCIVIGWFYNSRDQMRKVGRLSLYVFNSSFWIFNIAATLGELLDETLPIYLWWLIRLIGILVATFLSLLIYSFTHKSDSDPLLETDAIDPMNQMSLNIGTFNTYNENLGHLNNTQNFGNSENGVKDLATDNSDNISDPPKSTKQDKELKKRAGKARRRNLLEVLYILYIGNIENFRKEFYRISPMNKCNNICWSIIWSISIKWISCCLLCNALADILEEILSSERVERNIHTIPNNFKILTIVLWLVLILIIILYPYLKKLLFKDKTNLEVIDLSDLPSYPNAKYKFKFTLGYIFRELF